MPKYKCNKALYKAFLQASSIRFSGVALSEVSPKKLSHDGVSRWLSAKTISPKEVWKAVKADVLADPCGILCLDDSVIEKNHSSKIGLTAWQYSGNAHAVVNGIGMVNLIFSQPEKDNFTPIDFRIYDKKNDNYTKNDHFRKMLGLAKKRGILPSVVVFDSWYSSLNNLKFINSVGWNWVTNLRKNRAVNHGVVLKKLNIPDEGLRVYLRGYGWISVFKFVGKNGHIDYISTNIKNPTRNQVKMIIKARWSIEVFHRELKQTSGIRSCQARSGRAQRNHICLAVLAWIDQLKLKLCEKISHYGQKWLTIRAAVKEKISFLIANPT